MDANSSPPRVRPNVKKEITTHEERHDAVKASILCGGRTIVSGKGNKIQSYGEGEETAGDGVDALLARVQVVGFTECVY